jgi:hypothetical protein
LSMPKPTKDPYQLTDYDSVYIILKPSAENHEGYKGLVKFDKSRKKYFFSGKVIQDETKNRNAFPFVPEKNIEAFKKAKKLVDKQQYLVFILFGHIDYVTLQFDSFDWMR